MKRFKYLSWLLTLALLLGLSSCAISGPSTASDAVSSPPVAPSVAVPEGADAEGAATQWGLRVDFLNVGQADSALVRCGGAAMLIDGGNVDDSSYVVSFLKAQGVERLDYVVASHAHEDHAGGLSGPLNTCTAARVFCSVSEAEGKYFSDFQRYTAAQGLTIEVPQVGDTWPLGDATVTVLGPVKDYSDANNSSLVLAVDYGETSFLFTGDMEREAERDLLASGEALSATVLKVSHHGSGTSSSSAFLDAVDAKYAVISVGAGNSYGHPAEETLERLHNFGITVYRTDQAGIVTCCSDGRTLTFSTDNYVSPTVPPPMDSAEFAYIGNSRSQVFHRPDCSSLPKEENQVSFSSRQEALDAGYRPCGNCNP